MKDCFPPLTLLSENSPTELSRLPVQCSPASQINTRPRQAPCKRAQTPLGMLWSRRSAGERSKLNGQWSSPPSTRTTKLGRAISLFLPRCCFPSFEAASGLDDSLHSSFHTCRAPESLDSPNKLQRSAQSKRGPPPRVLGLGTRVPPSR